MLFPSLGGYMLKNTQVYQKNSYK